MAGVHRDGDILIIIHVKVDQIHYIRLPKLGSHHGESCKSYDLRYADIQEHGAAIEQTNDRFT